MVPVQHDLSNITCAFKQKHIVNLTFFYSDTVQTCFVIAFGEAQGRFCFFSFIQIQCHTTQREKELSKEHRKQQVRFQILV